MGRGKRGAKRSRGARSSSPATRGGRGGRGRKGEVDGGGGSASMAGRGDRSGHGHGSEGHDGAGGSSPTPAGQGGPGDGQSRGRDDGGGDRSSPSSGKSGRSGQRERGDRESRGRDDGDGDRSSSLSVQSGREGHCSAEDSRPANFTPEAAKRTRASAINTTPPSTRASPSSTTPPNTRASASSSSPPSSATPPSAATAPSVLGNPPAENYAAKIKTPREELASHRFYDFLQTYMGGSIGDPFYVAEIKSMRSKKLWTLQIQFRHLRVFSRHFAHYVCNNRQRIWGWLLSAVRKFLLVHCVDADGSNSDTINSIKNDVTLNAELEFVGIPNSIESLPIFLNRNKDDLSVFMNICFETGKSVLLSSPIGSHTFQSCVQHLIENHILGRSWNGDFTVEDWDVINGCEMELMKPSVPFTSEYGAADLGKIDSELLPRYLKIDKDGKKVVPLYFRELDVDLKVTSQAIKSEEDLRWYREYILSHVAYKPPVARINLIRGFFREIKTYNLSSDPLFKDFLTKAKESCYLDWRPLITTTKSDMLLEIYWHGVPKVDRPNATPKFDESIGSLLGFKRNSCEHIEENSRDKRGKQLMKTSVEAEVFPASKVSKFLPFLIKNLLLKCKMEGCFKEMWQAYKTSGFNSKLGIRKAKG